ncbi:hypothetical protein ACTOB_004362 [Actinoplanes oblitus]|uniref:Uncharacterized protein n=1 Tax=Actinoplanes oblitus TaxID=3040509 RepID=A0ABY8WS07_9ACTN|nr:hypothetical protein [Actinoplanes oblitus]WIN00645.1 hypothetical protein ACTOB_004362 [Actinoplanes oblitus]
MEFPGAKPDDERDTWVAAPLVSVGPLRFGATHAEVTAALGGASSVPTPGDRHLGGARFDSVGVTTYYVGGLADGHLSCVAVDAFTGPQVLLDGVALTGRDPSVVERWTWTEAERDERTLYYSGDADPALAELGLVVRSQRAGDAALTRPVFVGYVIEVLDEALPDPEWATR